jgi:hypothetical protein
VTVAASAITSPAFQITTTPVAVSTPVTITGTYNGVASSSTLTVNPPTPSAVTLTQKGASGGATIGGSVTLNAPAPTGGLVVALASSQPNLAQVPATVTVPAGATVSPRFHITTTPGSAQAQVKISATYNGTTATATLTVSP